jgi:hypothetical protein
MSSSLLYQFTGADDILSVVMDKLADRSQCVGVEAELAFEFRALETILETVVRVLDQDFNHVHKEVRADYHHCVCLPNHQVVP